MEVFGRPVSYDEIGEHMTHGLTLVWDISGYALLPHADDPRVIFNFLFYLPKDEETSQFGTSVYVPKARDFTSSGEPRHARGDFELVHTFPFVPNAMFSFLRTPNSFHGVEPVTGDYTERRLLLYSIRVDEDIESSTLRERARSAKLRV